MLRIACGPDKLRIVGSYVRAERMAADSPAT